MSVVADTDGGAAEAAKATEVADAVKVDEAAKADEKLREPGLKALQTERDARAAAEARVKEYEDKIREFEDREKSEAQLALEKAERLAADLDAAKASVAAAELNATRLEVAHTKGIPADLVVRLRGETREALEADADDLLKIIGSANEGGARKPKPVANLGVGGDAKLTPAEQFKSLMEEAF